MAKPEEIHRLVVACWNVDHLGVFDIELPERAPLSHGVPEQKLPTSRTYIEAADTDWCSTQTRVDILPFRAAYRSSRRILARPRWLRQQGHRSLRVTTTPLGVVIGDVTSITLSAVGFSSFKNRALSEGR